MTTTIAYGRIKIGYLLNASRTYVIHNTYGAPGLRRDKTTWTIFRTPSPETNASYVFTYRLLMGQNVSLIHPVRKIAACLNKNLEDLNNRK
jgi:hypothetical protein